ncbi:hypothetical protein [Bradyrhizobium elkanii]|uniref:hypothetical protein n=1 Tax=Bradyrhizobium elkanii TaxID=29448 RepID=UPI001448C00E|nr:hypothetical protein [Bradyrhizobium elkanii]MCS3576551.1 CheY-like chemotaxis protein [Bradyrhizobium elkanii]MCS3719440.1 CheY-like chemotaxis protein [Bradyrhizobium elkanii]MCS4003845.1 CheY-like chemotaxis protein [Bradyrhizobium elkanii USDA 61]BBB99008.1 hypothetical protein BE61_44490 [Bradyrhizobium elkanii USDA 61]
MIKQLASPSVLVIDDEPDDYDSILKALNDLHISAVWIQGTSLEHLPEKPFNRLQLVFLDLHLTNSLGKDAASHTANVFKHVVSAETAPIVVVIWSKYADDPVTEAGVPPEEQETESELFKRTLMEAEPKFKNRLIFLEMAKPKKEERPADWNAKLQEQIAATLGNQTAVGLLWTWDGLVKDANSGLLASLTDLAEETAGGITTRLTDDHLKEVLQRLSKAQGEADLSDATAPGHLVAILSQLLMDQLEHATGPQALAEHGAWLNSAPTGKTKASVAAKMNGFLLTAGCTAGAIPYLPGTVYAAKDIESFLSVFGSDREHLEKTFCTIKRTATNGVQMDEWYAAVRPVLLEISPVCDVAQNKRRNAHLVGGLVVPSAKIKQMKTGGDAWAVLPPSGDITLTLRWPLDGFTADEVKLVFHHSLKVTLNATAERQWFSPWFRLRELPTTAVRNPHMSHGSRVGYVSVA